MRRKYFIVVFIVVLLAALLQLLFTEDLERSGTERMAIVKYYKFYNYTVNPKTGERVRFHRIEYDYHINGKSYSKIEDVLPEDFNRNFSSSLQSGDSIQIIVSDTNFSLSKINLSE